MKMRSVKKIGNAIPYNEIDIELVPLIKEMSTLPFLRTDFCCAGYGKSRRKDDYGRTNHNYCGAGYISIRYKNDYRSNLFHDRLMNLNIFDKETFTNIYGGVGYYIHYRSKNCITNTIPRLKCGTCNGSGEESYSCTQDELPEKWKQVLNFIKNWKKENEFPYTL